MDNAEYWTSPHIWQKVLYHIHVVVSTPAILQQALNHGCTMKSISLLVFDEAHHCVKDSPMNSIMKLHYHPKLTQESRHELPHILGLSASPITKKNKKEVVELEENLDATCKSPLQQLEEYTAFVNMPEPLVLEHSPTPDHPSTLLDLLTATVCAVKFEHDPIVAVLRRSENPHAQEKLEKMLKKQRTPAMEEMQVLVRSCTDIQQSLGTWACDMLIKKCLEKVELMSSREHEFAAAGAQSAARSAFMASTLQSLHIPLRMANLDLNTSDSVSSKVKLLLEFLQDGYQSNLRCLIFVKTRVTAWLLTDLINSHPLTHDQYCAFSFVRVSNPTHTGICDFAELREQHDNLESFRNGELNVCVATSVLEEGVDVPAMNLVICFDERPNFRSFIQSRGRARQRESQFVMFSDTALKTRQWQALEDEMNDECQKSLDSIRQRERAEGVGQADSEVFRIPSTG
jgi:ERCC4-related helicase